MKKLKIKKKVLCVFMVTCIASTLIMTISASNITSNDILGEWTLNEHIAPPDPTDTNVQMLQAVTFEYTYNNTQKVGNDIIFTSVNNEFQMGITYTEGENGYKVDNVYNAVGNWYSGNFKENFSRTINITYVYEGNIADTYNWLLANATRTISTTSTTYITINNTSTQITFNNGSSWAEWVNSTYNTIGITADETYLYLNNQRMYDNSSNWVRINDLIETYGSPGLAYFFRSYNKTFTVMYGNSTQEFTYLSTLVTWADYVPTNPNFYIDENKVYYMGEYLTQNNIEVLGTDTINNGIYQVRYSDEWYEGYLKGYEYGTQASILNIGDIVDGTITGAKNIFVNAFGFELFGINIASTLISILVIAIVIFVVKKLR